MNTRTILNLPNVFLITADSLRHDHIDLSSSRTHTPNLARFAEKSVVFEKCYVCAPWTGASLASLMTSLYPSEHGLLRQKKSHGAPKSIDSPIREDIPFLPLMLQRHGYQTSSFQGNVAYNNSRYRFTRGFDYYSGEFRNHSSKLHTFAAKLWSVYSEMSFVHMTRILSAELLAGTYKGKFSHNRYFRRYYSADSLSVRFEKFIKHYLNTPSFVWIHFLEPHYPYVPPKKYIKLPCPTSDNKDYYTMPGSSGEDKLDQAQKDYIIARYNGQISFLDESFGKLMALLKQRGILDNSVVIFSSDHGEELFDHGTDRSDPHYYNRGWGHGHSQYEELIRVPLIIRIPGASVPKIVDIPVTNLDIMPTILELVSANCDMVDMRGTSIVPLFHGVGNSIFTNRPFFSESIINGTEKKAMVLNTKKLIWHIEENVFEYYDMDSDPDEHNDLFAKHRECTGPMQVQLVSWAKAMDDLRTRRTGESVDTSEDIKKRLHALGYLE